MFWNKPLPHKLRQQDLEEAQRELHDMLKRQEYCTAMVCMYEGRVERLQEEIARDKAAAEVAQQEYMSRG